MPFFSFFYPSVGIITAVYMYIRLRLQMIIYLDSESILSTQTIYMAFWVTWPSWATRQSKIIRITINHTYGVSKIYKRVNQHCTDLFHTEKRCFKAKIMKGYRKKQATFFKNGNKLSISRKKKVIKMTENQDENVQYVRPSIEEADLVDQNPIQPLAMKSKTANDATGTTYRCLRPKKSTLQDRSKEATSSNKHR